jgi:TonB family protein
MFSIIAGLLLQGLVQAETPSAAPPPPPPPPPPTGRIEPARARANLGSLISNEDYPAEALRNDHQGTVGFRLTVSAAGRVTGCTITQSSGHASLDSTTCRLLTARARFDPARDSRGRPTTDSVSARIVWRIEEELLPMAAKLLVGTLTVSPAGAVACTLTIDGTAVDPGECPTPVEGMIRTARSTGRTAEQTLVEIIAPDGQPAPVDPANFGELFLDAEARVRVAADGSVIECRVTRVETPGMTDPEDANRPCEPFPAGKPAFEPAAAGSPERTVTITTRFYGRR